VNILRVGGGLGACLITLLGGFGTGTGTGTGTGAGTGTGTGTGAGTGTGTGAGTGTGTFRSGSTSGGILGLGSVLGTGGCLDFLASSFSFLSLSTINLVNNPLV